MDVFVDLDGVIADFDEGYPRLFGHNHREIEDAAMWKNIDEHGSFFYSLRPGPKAIEFLTAVRAVSTLYLSRDPIILTACSTSWYEDVKAQKLRWIAEYIGDIEVRTVTKGRDKPQKMNAPGDILIDDWSGNIKAWHQAMGLGILHRIEDPFFSLQMLVNILSVERAKHGTR